MMWGTFTTTVVDKQIKSEESINAKEYIQLLEKRFLLTVQQLMMRETMIFQQENTPTHTAQMTQWLAENSFELMFWPS